jgi:hypothetical protein
MRKITILLTIVALSACSSPLRPTPARVVEVPSSKPYNYIKWSKQCPASVNRAIRAHNRAHQRVKRAENIATRN